MIKMRQQFVATMSEMMKSDDRLAILLGDIGVFGFRQLFAEYPHRIYNIGILEQATVGMAAGMAMAGFIPVVHTIAPFLVERSFEQLKIDFGYQGLGGNFVSVGASYDYAGLGCTHHCPGDVGILKNIPNMSIVLPGTALEFNRLFKEAYTNQNPTYYRLSESSNQEDQNVRFGKAEVLKDGSDTIIIAVGTMLGPVWEAVKDLNVTLLYYTTIRPFDSATLISCFKKGDKIIVCEPYYSGALSFEITHALKFTPTRIEHIGVPHAFLLDYGVKEEHDAKLGLTAEDIKSKILGFSN